MTEEKPKSLGERGREKENKGKRTEIEVSEDGYLSYPEEKVEITTEGALESANKVIQEYSDPEVLFKDFSDRERANAQDPERWVPDDATMRKVTESSLEVQRDFARPATTDGLLTVFALHNKNPKHYYGTMLLAYAEELKRRLNPPAN